MRQGQRTPLVAINQSACGPPSNRGIASNGLLLPPQMGLSTVSNGALPSSAGTMPMTQVPSLQ